MAKTECNLAGDTTEDIAMRAARSAAAWICCPMCDMQYEIPRGRCPGRFVCNEITRYMCRAEAAENDEAKRLVNVLREDTEWAHEVSIFKLGMGGAA